MIALMDRLEIVCLRETLEPLTGFLQEQGVVELEEVPLALDAAPGFLRRVHLDDAQKARLERLEELERMLREITPLLDPKPAFMEIAAAALALAAGPESAWAGHVKEWSHALRALTRRRLNIQDNIEVLRNYGQLLETIRPAVGGRAVTFGEDARAIVLQGDVARAIEALEERLNREIGTRYELIQQRAGSNKLVGVLTYDKAYNEAIGKVLRQQGIEPVEAPDKSLQGGAPLIELIDRVEETIRKQREALAEAERETQAFSREHGAQIMAAARLVADELAQLRAVRGFAHSEMLGVVHGWIPRQHTADLKRALHAKFPGELEVNILPMDDVAPARVPTKLENPRFFKPFEVLLSIFQAPTYGTYDPTKIVAISFILFYGFILGDAVYGAAVILFAIWLRKKWGHIEAVKSAGTVGIYMGISSIFFGVLYAEYLGNYGEKAFGLHPIFLHRSHETDELIIWALLAGVVHVPLGLVLGIREDLRHHHKTHALEKIGFLIGLMGAGVGILWNFKLGIFSSSFFLYLSIILLLVFVSIMLRAAGAMGAVLVLELVSLIGNILSYSRLMALGLASVIVADLANEAARGLPFYAGIPLALMIHILNLVIGMFSPTIHSLRLNYVEFMPKFYSAEGRSYKPFKKEALC